jgi:hypothetical protein
MIFFCPVREIFAFIVRNMLRHFCFHTSGKGQRAYLCALLPVFLCCMPRANAQLDNTYLRDEITVNEQDSNASGLSVATTAYLRNTEYFNPIESGRTLFGYQLHPKLFYQPHGQVKLEAGVFLRHDFGGSNPYTQALPTFTLKVKNNNFSLLFGTLEGALSHRLIEPMFDISAVITRRIENGLQLKYDGPKQFTDVWINWENFIERGSPFKEVFTAGVSNMTSLYESSSGFKVKVPLQFTAHHHGGQITTDTGNMVMQFNAAAGLRVSKEFERAFIRELRLDGYYTIYYENSNSGYFPYRDGNGIYANALLRMKMLDVMLSYWNASGYLAPRGSTIYQSMSIDKTGYSEKNRELAILRFLYERPLFNTLYMSVRFEPVYDLRNKLFDYSYSFYLTYKKDIRFKRVAR